MSDHLRNKPNIRVNKRNLTTLLTTEGLKKEEASIYCAEFRTVKGFAWAIHLIKKMRIEAKRLFVETTSFFPHCCCDFQLGMRNSQGSNIMN